VDQSLIAIKQGRRESDIASSANIVISDCPQFLAHIYANILSESAKETQDVISYHLGSAYKMALRSLPEYSDYVLVQLHEYIENGVRYNGADAAIDIHERIQKFMKQVQIPYTLYDRTKMSINELINILFSINSGSNVLEFLRKLLGNKI
jgi:hypothetical protein